MIKLVYKGVCMALKRELDEYTNNWEEEYLKE